jgi:putative redox protein
MDMVSQIFDFESPHGYRLSGILETPVATVRGWAIFAHCFTCGKDSPAAARIARGLARAGVGVLRFDFAGVGASGGDFAASTFAADAEDLVAAGQAMAAAGMQPELLLGHSLGGSAVLLAADAMPAVRAVATLAAPADVAHVLHHFEPESLARIKSNGEAAVRLGERDFIVRQSFIDNLSRHNLIETVGRLRKALLILHAPTDATVGIDNATRIFVGAKHPKSFISLDSADHLLTRLTDAEFAADTIAAWASRYLPDKRSEMMEPDSAASAIADETGAGLFQTQIRFRGASLIADEPVEVGGLGSGPGPFDLVSAGLAACTNMTLRLYANRKGIPLERARTTVTHVRTMETPADRFRRTLVLEGPLSDDERQTLLTIAERCPVDLALARGADVTAELAERE